jgi:hypothetical protein
MNIGNVEAFVIGIVIPLIVVLLGRESIGKMLLGKARREDTALSALIGIVQESLQGWKESNAAVMRLSTDVGRHNTKFEQHSAELTETLREQSARIVGVDDKITTLIKLMASSGDSEEAVKIKRKRISEVTNG